MPVFDGANKTPTRIGLRGDSFSPGMGTLVGSAKKEDALVKGDFNYLITAKQTWITMGSRTTTILGTNIETLRSAHFHTVMGAAFLTYLRTLGHIVVGVQTNVNISAIVETIIGSQVRTNAAPQQETQSASWFEVKLGPVGAFYAIINLSTGTFNVAAFINNYELYAAQINLLGVNACATGINGAATGIDDAAEAMENRIKGMENKMEAMDNQLGAMQPAIYATTINVLIIGVNQYI